VILSLARPNLGLTSRQLSSIIKEIAETAAAAFPTDSLSHKKLKRLSPHWLRHLSASRQDLAGMAFTNIKSNLRHQNEQTTRIYVHADDDARHKDMEKLRLF
jgi:site-specific recombinase XerD